MDKVYISNQGLEFIIVGVDGSNRIVRFLNSGYEYSTDLQHAKKGVVKDPYHRSVFGVGYLGVGEYKTRVNYKREKSHADWENMLSRCYYNKNPRFESYGGKGVTVCEDWKNYQNFAKWYKDNYVEGFHLDKDCINWGCKEYSPLNCAYVPRYINNLLVHKHRSGLMFGVNYSSKGRYRVRSSVSGTLGYYNSEEEAHLVYKAFKLNHIKETADYARRVGDITEKVYLGLMAIDINENGFYQIKEKL